MRYGAMGGQGGRGGYGAVGGRSGGIAKPRSMRGFRDATGQLIIDHDEENLSDKELYARNILAIGQHHLLCLLNAYLHSTPAPLFITF